MLPPINSYAYVIAPLEWTPRGVKGLIDDLAKTPFDMVIFGNIFNLAPNIIHSAEQPLADKIIIGYLDIAASTALVTNKYVGAKTLDQIPSYFGKPQSGFIKPNPVQNLYTVKYWVPEWFDIIKKQIDDQIAAGYDGLFLDEVTGDSHWYSTNRAGNEYYPNATYEMANLIRKIHSYISSKNLSKPFYLIGNNTDRIFGQHPDLVKLFDQSMRESIHYNQSAQNGAVSVADPNSTNVFNYIKRTYGEQNILVNDYPPLSSVDTIVPILKKYNIEGWVPSLQKAFQDTNLLLTGPFIIQANNVEPVVSGANFATNYLLSGEYGGSTLNGGDTTNYYVLTNQSTVNGGNSQDTIYVWNTKPTISNNVINGNGGLDKVIYETVFSNVLFKLEKGGVVSLKSDVLRLNDTLSEIETIQFTDKKINLKSLAHESYSDIPEMLYQMLVSVFDIAPGVVYMNELASAYRWWSKTLTPKETIEKIVEVLSTKPFFTNVYPSNMTDRTFAFRLIYDFIENSVSTDVRDAVIADVEAALKVGWSRAKIISQVIYNISQMSTDHSVFGSTVKLIQNETKVAKCYTEYFDQSTTNFNILGGLMDIVNHQTKVDTEEDLIQFVGTFILNIDGGL
jgi:uncharacterized protein (TIGR01370 family)